MGNTDAATAEIRIIGGNIIAICKGSYHVFSSQINILLSLVSGTTATKNHLSAPIIFCSVSLLGPNVIITSTSDGVSRTSVWNYVTNSFRYSFI